MINEGFGSNHDARRAVASLVTCPRGFMPLLRKGTKFGENEGFSKKLLINAGKFLLWF